MTDLIWCLVDDYGDGIPVITANLRPTHDHTGSAR